MPERTIPLMSKARARPEGLVGRTPDEFEALVKDLRENPAAWFLYSQHISDNSARVRASQLRHDRFPNALMELKDGIEFLSKRQAGGGALVLVRYVPPS